MQMWWGNYGFPTLLLTEKEKLDKILKHQYQYVPVGKGSPILV